MINLGSPELDNLGADLVTRPRAPVDLANSIIDQTGYGSYIDIQASDFAHNGGQS